MITSKTAELSTWIREIDIFSQSEIAIYSSEVMNMDKGRRHSGRQGAPQSHYHFLEKISFIVKSE